MGGGDGEAACRLGGKLFARLAQIFRLLEHLLGDGDDGFARLGDFDHSLAVADEYFHTEFLLQQSDLLGNSRLGRMQRQGGVGYIQALPNDLDQIAQLL